MEEYIKRYGTDTLTLMVLALSLQLRELTEHCPGYEDVAAMCAEMETMADDLRTALRELPR